MTRPAAPKIYHIVHVDRLASIIADGYLWADAVIVGRQAAGTTIGMNSIKQRRLRNELACHPGLHVGECVPFYFCPRSIMLYVISCANHPELAYRGGQGPIVHLEADLGRTVKWAEQQGKRWAFTLSNAGSRFYEDRSDLGRLNELDWDAIDATQWAGAGVSPQVKEGKQAEFLIEECFPWHLVDHVAVATTTTSRLAEHAINTSQHRPPIHVRPGWYY